MTRHALTSASERRASRIGSTFLCEAGVRAALTVSHADRRDDVDMRRSDAMLQTLPPYFTRAVQIHRRVSDALGRRADPESAADRLSAGIILVNPTCPVADAKLRDGADC